LSEQPDFEVVSEAGDGTTVLRLVEELCPDVLVLDLIMPGLSGLAVLEELQLAGVPLPTTPPAGGACVRLSGAANPITTTRIQRNKR
jgi:DNA-binding NarL/FixJ family response regulator